MNREEAIKVIKSNWPDERYTMLRKALELAIEALEDSDRLDEAEDLLSQARSIMNEVHLYSTELYDEIGKFLYGEED